MGLAPVATRHPAWTGARGNQQRQREGPLDSPELRIGPGKAARASGKRAATCNRGPVDGALTCVSPNTSRFSIGKGLCEVEKVCTGSLGKVVVIYSKRQAQMGQLCWEQQGRSSHSILLPHPKDKLSTTAT